MASDYDTPAGGPETKKLTAAEIARDWGTSRAYVSARIKAGCPTTTLEAARTWREENSRYGVGYRSKGKPKPGDGDAELPLSATKRERDADLPAATDLTALQSSVKAAIQMETVAYGNALAKNTEANVRAYNNARDGRFAAEKAYREEMERRKILVSMDEAKALGRRGYDILLPKLRALGSQIAADCNQEQPLQAMRVIDHAIASILAMAEQAYAA